MTAGVVTLRKTDGTTIKVPLDQLSEDDREWIEKRRRANNGQLLRKPGESSSSLIAAVAVLR